MTSTWCHLSMEEEEEEEDGLVEACKLLTGDSFQHSFSFCIHTWLLVPLGAAGDEHAAPPEAHGPVETEQGVAVGFLVELPVQKLLVERAQLRHVGLAAHGGAAVLVPVLRPDGHGQIHGGQQAQHAGDHQRCGVAVVHHCSPRRLRVKED